MAAEKLSISLDSDLAAGVRALAAQQGMTVSAWLAEAAAARVRNIRLREALDAWEAEFGRLSEEEEERLVAEARSRSIHVNQQRRSA
ncbi:MAG: hypothetical protein M3R63_12390 [Actinomycetota bacterium]|nr:hypothetical protein [Actinomycetota bacterium]